MVKRMMVLTYSANIIRQHDKDRFLISLLMPRRYREALWALFAFNYEIAKTREIVTDQTIGLIRLQWWRDEIAKIYEGKNVSEHEILKPLGKAIKEYNLSRELFDGIIYAREFDLEGVPPADINGLLNYCEFTNVPLNQLALKILGQEEDFEVIKKVSVRYSLLGTLRSVPYMVGRGQIMLPQDILTKYNLSPKKISDFNKKEEIIDVIKDVLIEFENNQNQLQNDELLIKSNFMHSINAISLIYQSRFHKFNFDVFDPKFQSEPAFKALRVWLFLIRSVLK